MEKENKTCWPLKIRQRHLSNKVESELLPNSSTNNNIGANNFNNMRMIMDCDHISKADFNRVREILKKGPYHKAASNGANALPLPNSWNSSLLPGEAYTNINNTQIYTTVNTSFPTTNKVINFGPPSHSTTRNGEPQAMAGILNIGDCQIRVSSSTVDNMATPEFDNYDTLDTFEACKLNLIDISRLTTSNAPLLKTLPRGVGTINGDLFAPDFENSIYRTSEAFNVESTNTLGRPEDDYSSLQVPRNFVNQLMTRLSHSSKKLDISLRKHYLPSQTEDQLSTTAQNHQTAMDYVRFEDPSSKEVSVDLDPNNYELGGGANVPHSMSTSIQGSKRQFSSEPVDELDYKAMEPLGGEVNIDGCSPRWPPVHYEYPEAVVDEKDFLKTGNPLENPNHFDPRGGGGGLGGGRDGKKTQPLVFKRVRKRLVNKYGSTNVVQSNISNRKQHFLSDIYTTMLDSRWRWSVLIFALGFLLSWTLFSVVWWLICFSHGDFEHASDPSWRPCFKNAYTFTSAFLFSIETQHTIGYGYRHITEECPEGVLLFVIQSITGAMIQGFVIGLIFSKLSRPKKRAVTLMFSRTAVICTRDGDPCLLVRIGDMRRSHIIDARTRAYLFRKKVTLEGEVIPLHPHHMPLAFDPPHPSGPSGTDRIFLAWPSILVHRIDANSPLYPLGARDLAEEKFEIVVILEGMIEASGMSMQARTSYLPHEIAWGHRFQKLITFVREDGDYNVDYSAFHLTVPINMPLCSARHLELLRAKYREAQVKQRRPTDRVVGRAENQNITELVGRLELLIQDLKTYVEPEPKE